MSVRIMSMVFERYQNGGGEMLLALALADHAHDDGTSIYPSIEQLAYKTRQSERTVQYQLRAMEKSGWLILVNFGNGGRGARREYRISTDWLKGANIAPLSKIPIGENSVKGAEIAPQENKGATDGQKGAIQSTKGATDDVKGAKLLHPHITVTNHHESSENRQDARGKRLPKDWTLSKALGDWALEEQPTWTPEHVRRVADKFRDYWVAVAGKAARKTDWPATWRNWCRNEKPLMAGKPAGQGAWWATDDSVMAKGAELGLKPLAGESMPAFKGRVQATIDNGGQVPPPPPSRITAVRKKADDERGTKPNGLNLKALIKQKGRLDDLH
ncbi:helix-turn-helix domain-containing protein [Collimonas pratensis]|nr:helix-turn-helix domain-containing protein [Collimonas pratensis]